MQESKLIKTIKIYYFHIFRKIDAFKIESDEKVTRRVTRSQKSENSIKSESMSYENDQSKPLLHSDTPTQSDSNSEKIILDRSQSLFTNQSENICDIVPHIQNDVLENHILSLISSRLGIQYDWAKDFIGDKANQDTLIPGLHEKFPLYILDFFSVFTDKEWLTSLCIENYLNLVLMNNINKDICLGSFIFQYYVQEHLVTDEVTGTTSLDTTNWIAGDLERHFKSSFGCHIKRANYVLIPSCYNSHFILTYFDVYSKKAVYYDSAGSKHRISKVKEWFKPFVNYIWGDAENWTLSHSPEPIKQPDQSSCGVYTAFTARKLVLNDVMIVGTSAWQFRARLTMTLSLLCNKIFPIS